MDGRDQYTPDWMAQRAFVLAQAPERMRAAMLEVLTARERAVLEACLRGVTVRSIADHEGVSYSRAHQIHAKAFLKLAGALAAPAV
jgi:FixJ family two-component response regulator